MKKQVNKDHYTFDNYGYLERWASYFYQLQEISFCSPKSILEIGVGDRILGSYIKNNTDIKYQSLDIDEDLEPDIVGSIERIEVPDSTYDMVCAFEVLEHLPFEKFEQALREMKRISSRYVVLSLPHFGPPVKFLLKIPYLPEIKVAFKLPFPRKHIFNGEHYWEIGKRGYPLRAIRDILEKHFTIEKEFVPFENQYHHFYILEKK